MSALLEISTPQALAELLEGLSDTEIASALTEAGPREALEQVFATMAARFRPAHAEGVNAVIQWVVETPEGAHDYHLRVASGACTWHPGRAEAAHVTLAATAPVFLRLVAGLLHGIQAHARGQVRIEGDVVVALRQQVWFDADLERAELDVSTPRQLAGLITGRTDEEIVAGVSVAGLDTTIDRVLDGMVRHYLPERGPRRGAVVEFRVRGPGDTRVFQLEVDRHGARAHHGTPHKSNVKIGIALPDFLRLVSGRLDGIAAFARGKLKARGNLLLARKIPGWFDMNR